MPALPLQPLRLPVHPLIALPRLLPLLKAQQTRHFQPQQKLRLAAKQTAKAWNVCSRNRCPSSARLQELHLDAALVAAFFMPRPAAAGTPSERPMRISTSFQSS